jgi:hypothetical protein
LIASPGFVKDQFFEYMFAQAVKTDNKVKWHILQMTFGIVRIDGDIRLFVITLLSNADRSHIKWFGDLRNFGI